jgi:CDP-paratose 2-epimerase
VRILLFDWSERGHDEPYTVYGYRGKQVRDNIHSADLVRGFECVARVPRPGSVYNIGGGREVNCSMLEAIEFCERIAGRPLEWSCVDRNRMGDHIWWIGDLSAFRADYPEWSSRYGVEQMLEEIFDRSIGRWISMDCVS